MSDFDMRAQKSIPAEIRMISGCEDAQTSADVSNVSNFELPDPNGRAGGACSSAFLSIVYADHKKPDEDLSFQDVLTSMRGVLSDQSFEQIPQLSSSRAMDIETKFDLTPDNFSGTKRAVLIGINYVGQNGELAGCHNDVLNIIDYIKDVHSFEDKNMTVLMDDGLHSDPTRDNIMEAYQKIAADSQPGDVVFLHYSGHGGKLRDDNGEEADGYDETLIPLDYQQAGQIRDDDLLRNLVMQFQKGVFVTSIMDCCHSGTVLDLPYNFKADGNQTAMEPNEGYDFDPMDAILSGLGGGAAGSIAAMVGSCCMDAIKGMF